MWKLANEKIRKLGNEVGISWRILEGLGLRRKTKNIRSRLRGILAKKGY